MRSSKSAVRRSSLRQHTGSGSERGAETRSRDPISNYHEHFRCPRDRELRLDFDVLPTPVRRLGRAYPIAPGFQAISHSASESDKRAGIAIFVTRSGTMFRLAEGAKPLRRIPLLISLLKRPLASKRCQSFPDIASHEYRK